MYLYLETGHKSEAFNCRGEITEKDMEDVNSYAFTQSRSGLRCCLSENRLGDKKIALSVFINAGIDMIEPKSVKQKI